MVNAHAVTGAVAQRLLDHRAEMRVVDHDVAKPAAGEALELPFHQPPAAHREQWLRTAIGERAHPFAATGGEDHRVHQNVYPIATRRSSSASNSRSSGARAG